MNTVFIITPIYNADKVIDRYIESFSKSFESNKSNTKFQFVFVVDEDTDKYDESLLKLSKYADLVIIHNIENKGVTYSRNKAAELINEAIKIGDFVVNIDIDDQFTKDSVKLLSELNKYSKYNDPLIVFPRKLDRNKNHRLYGKLVRYSDLLSQCPAIEADYVWSYEYFKYLMYIYGNLYYYDKYECKYYPEFIRFLEECLFNENYIIYISKDSLTISDYENGNITKDIYNVMHKNMYAFVKLAELFRIYRDRFKVNKELDEYINWLSKYKVLYEDSGNK